MSKYRFIGVFCVAILLVILLPVSAAETDGFILEDNFRGYSIGTLPYGSSQTWSDYNNRGFTQWIPRLATDPKDTSNQVLAIDKSTASANTKNEHLVTNNKVLSGRIEVSFRFYVPSNAKTDGEVTYNAPSDKGVTFGLVDSANAASFLVASTLCLNSNTTGASVVPLINSHGQERTITVDEWHTLRMVIDTETKTRETYLDNSLIYLLEQFTTEIKFISQFRIVVPGNLPESLVYMDDFNLEKVVEPWYYKVDDIFFGKGMVHTAGPVAEGYLKQINLSKSNETDGNATLITAFYNKHGALKAVKPISFYSENFNESNSAVISVNMSLPDDASEMNDGKVKIFIWDSLSGMKPLMERDLFVASTDLPKLYLIGDSTMVSYSETRFPRAGTGQMLGAYFNLIEIENKAFSGADTKDYLEHSNWRAISQEVKKGDYVMIQLGINDMLHDIGTALYERNIEQMTELLQAKGANVIVLTPTIRRRFNAEGKFRAVFDDENNFVSTDVFTTDGGADYLRCLKNFIAKKQGEMGFFAINMTAITAEMIGPNAVFEDNSRKYYMQDVYYNWDTVYAEDERALTSIFGDKTSSNFKNCEYDFTHLTIFGADVIAQKMAQAIYNLDVGLSKYVVNLEKTVTYPNLSYNYPN